MDVFVGAREASPVWVYDDTLETPKDTAHREKLIHQRALRRPYEIGCISALNERISSSERQAVSTHLPLVIESSDRLQMKSQSASYPRRATAIMKEKQSSETVHEPVHEQVEP
jgi:hypothetical protein